MAAARPIDAHLLWPINKPWPPEWLMMVHLWIAICRRLEPWIFIKLGAAVRMVPHTTSHHAAFPQLP